LELPDTWRIHPVFHAYLLSPYIENEVHGPNYLKPPAELINGQEEYEVEAIIGHRRRGRGHQFKIRWKDYPISEATWEPESNIKNAEDVLSNYKLTHHI
jgi:hypothetical protein